VPAMTSMRLPRDGPRRPGRIVWTAICVLLLTLVAAATWLVVAARHDALDRSDDAVMQAAAGAQVELDRALLSLDLQLSGLREVVADAWRPDGALAGPAAHRAMAALKERQLLFNDAALVDEHGRTLAASLPASDRDGLRLPEGFLARVFAQPAPELAVSEAVPSPSTGESSIYLARQVGLPGGRRALAVLEVPLPLLAEIISQGGMPGLVTTLERADGRVLVSVPSSPGPGMRRVLHDVPLDTAYGKGGALAPRRAAEPGFVAVRPSVYRALQVGVSLSFADALLPWRDERNIIAAATSALVVLTLIAGLVSQWQFNRLVATREALARSAVTLDQALSAMADGFLLCDRDDRVLRWNERYLELFPWLRPAMAVGVPFADLLRASMRSTLLDESDEVRERWVERRLELHRSGRDSWERDLGNGRVVNATDRRTPDGGVVSVFHDVTAAERRLEQARRSAEAANRAKSQFLATMSHEIRTPLNAVLGLNELMLHSPLDAQQRRFAELIGSSGRLLLTLINDILDVSRIEAGHVQLQIAPFSPRLAAEGVVALMQERALAKGLALGLTLAGTDDDEMLLGDVIRVQQILFNLIGNAVKFTASGEVLVALSVTPGERRTATLRLEVSDTGIGIPASALPTLFERFTQADSTTMRRYGGSGLGLAITHEIVQLMGGAIETCSTPGEGSRFVVTLPLRFADAGERKLSGMAPQPGAGAPAGLSILVAEDNDVNQILIGAVLERMGHRSRIVDDGRAAVDAARSERYDLVLMDLQMPDMDGLEATHAIRALGGAAGALPIIAMTANAFEEDRQACLDAGMNDYLAKPIDLASLAQAIARNARPGAAAAH